MSYKNEFLPVGHPGHKCAVQSNWRNIKGVRLACAGGQDAQLGWLTWDERNDVLAIRSRADGAAFNEFDRRRVIQPAEENQIIIGDSMSGLAESYGPFGGVDCAVACESQYGDVTLWRARRRCY